MAGISQMIRGLQGKGKPTTFGGGFFGNILRQITAGQRADKEEPELDPKEKTTRKVRDERKKQRQTAMSGTGGSDKLG